MNLRDIQDDLDQFVEGESWPEAAEDGTPIPPTTVEAADGILRRLHRLAQERADHQRVRDAEISKTEAWFADRTKGIDREIEWAEKALEPFHRAWVSAQPGKKPKKSLSLPDGTLKLTASGAPRMVVTNIAQLVDWAIGSGEVKLVRKAEGTVEVEGMAHREALRFTVVPDLSGIKAKLAETTDDKYTAVEDKPDVVQAPATMTVDGEIELVPGVALERNALDKFTLVLAEAVE